MLDHVLHSTSYPRQEKNTMLAGVKGFQQPAIQLLGVFVNTTMRALIIQKMELKVFNK